MTVVDNYWCGCVKFTTGVLYVVETNKSATVSKSKKNSYLNKAYSKWNKEQMYRSIAEVLLCNMTDAWQHIWN